MPINTSLEDLIDNPLFYKDTDSLTNQNATEMLGLDDDTAGRLFAACNTLEDLEEMVANLIKYGRIQVDMGDEDDVQ